MGTPRIHSQLLKSAGGLGIPGFQLLSTVRAVMLGTVPVTGGSVLTLVVSTTGAL